MKKQEQPKSSTVAFWLDQIAAYEREFKDWEEKADKIVKRYTDERKSGQKNTAQFNILWSNVQTLLPALYASQPVPNISRRFENDDDIGLTSSRILERCASYFVDTAAFDDLMKQAVLDRLLGGRGTVWARYAPNFGTKPQTTDDMVSDDVQEIYGEDVEIDYVHYRDFGHTWARTWQEVRAVWRKVYLDRAELVNRFGDKIGNKIPLGDDTKTQDSENQHVVKKACVYEIWDKKKKKAIWINKDFEDVLDEQDDPLHLKCFFPCPKPLFATISNDKLIPTPDYVLYQDQAIELDNLTSRIGLLIEALRVAGVYDKSAEGVQRLLSEGTQNKLIPVDNFALLGEKGGLKGIIDWFPIDQVVATLAALYEARDRVKSDLYEISGISDVIRGATDANETATAQQIKGQYANLRLGNMQGDVARFARDLVEMITEIVAEHFDLDTIKQISGIKLMTQQEKAMIPLDAQLPEELEAIAALPTWEEVEGVIRQDMPRCFIIDIETDSTIKADQDSEKAARTEFLTAAGGFLQQAIAVPDPELKPLLMELLMFGVRGLKVSRDIETTMKVALDKIKKRAEQPQETPPDPEMIKAQQQAQADAQKMQIEAGKVQAEASVSAQKIQIELQKAQLDAQIKAQELEIKRAELEIKRQELDLKEREIILGAQNEQMRVEADVTKERYKAKASVSPEVAMTDKELNGGHEITPMQAVVEQLGRTLTEGLMQMAEMQAQSNQQVIAAVTKPKSIVRGKDGKIIGVQ